MRLEKFKSVLVPVDLVLYAEKETDHLGRHKTFIYISIPKTAFVKSISIQGDCLDEFNEWFKQFDTRPQAPVPFEEAWRPLPNQTSNCQPPIVKMDDHTTLDPKTIVC